MEKTNAKRINLISILKWILTVSFFITAVVLVSQKVIAQQIGPQQLVKDTTYLMLDVLKKERDNLEREPGRIYGLIEEYLLPHFDFKGMSRFVIGKHWRNATDEQKQRFTLAFRDLLVRTYAGALKAYTDQTIVFLEPRKGDIKKKKALIRSQVEDSGNAVAVTYRLWKKKSGWKVYDISIEGVSLLSNFRTQLTNEVSQKGIERTIDTIHKQAADIDAQKIEEGA